MRFDYDGIATTVDELVVVNSQVAFGLQQSFGWIAEERVSMNQVAVA